MFQWVGILAKKFNTTIRAVQSGSHHCREPCKDLRRKEETGLRLRPQENYGLTRNMAVEIHVDAVDILDEMSKGRDPKPFSEA